MRLSSIPEMKYHAVFLAVDDNEKLAAVIQRMTRAGEHAVIATADDGRLSGIFTDHDLFDRVIARNADIKQLRLRDVMTTDVISARADEAAADALTRMEENSHHNIPVLDTEGKPAGMLRIEDLAAYASPDIGDIIRKDYEPLMIAGAIALYALAVTILLYAF